jgi:hypothetical protein
MDYYEKYLKYKQKYIQLKEQFGGNTPKFIRKGSYGCAYMPAFDCRIAPVKPADIPKNATEDIKKAYKIELNKYKNFYKGKISKMMNPAEAKKEFKELYIARGRDYDDEHVDGFANTVKYLI